VMTVLLCITLYIFLMKKVYSFHLEIPLEQVFGEKFVTCQTVGKILSKIAYC